MRIQSMVIAAILTAASPAVADWIASAQGDPPSTFLMTNKPAGDEVVYLTLVCSRGIWSASLGSFSVKAAPVAMVEVTGQAGTVRKIWNFKPVASTMEATHLVAEAPKDFIAWIEPQASFTLSFKTQDGKVKSTTYAGAAKAGLATANQKCGGVSARAPLGHGATNDRWATLPADDLLTAAQTSIKYASLDPSRQACEVINVAFRRLADGYAVWHAICKNGATWMIAHDAEGSVAAPCSDPRAAAYCR